MATPSHAKPISESSPTLLKATTVDPSGPAVRFTLGGLSADFLRGDVRVTAEITTGLRTRMFVVHKELRVMVEADLTRWRASIAFGGWRPLTNLLMLRDRVMRGMAGVHSTVETLPDLLGGQYERGAERVRPWARSLRVAGEALDSVWNAEPGWIVGLDAMGRIQDPWGLRLDPRFEVSLTATLVF